MAVQTQVVELMQEDIRERTEELRQVKNNLPEYDIERRRRGIANKLKKMLPGGVSEISAMSDDSGEIVTAPEDSAGCLNNHWQRILDKRHTDPIKRMEWLEEVRNKLRVSNEQLRPTRKLVRQVIKEGSTCFSMWAGCGAFRSVQGSRRGRGYLVYGRCVCHARWSNSMR